MCILLSNIYIIYTCGTYSDVGFSHGGGGSYGTRGQRGDDNGDARGGLCGDVYGDSTLMILYLGSGVHVPLLSVDTPHPFVVKTDDIEPHTQHKSHSQTKRRWSFIWPYRRSWWWGDSFVCKSCH